MIKSCYYFIRAINETINAIKLTKAENTGTIFSGAFLLLTCSFAAPIINTEKIKHIKISNRIITIPIIPPIISVQLWKKKIIM